MNAADRPQDTTDSPPARKGGRARGLVAGAVTGLAVLALSVLASCRAAPPPAPLPADPWQATRALTGRFQSGDVLNALRDAEAYVIASDGHPEAYRVLAGMFTHLEWPDQGLLAFDRLIATRPGDARARMHRAEMLHAFPARRDETIASLREALERDPALHEARLALAHELIDARRHDEARAEVERVRAEAGPSVETERTAALIETRAGRPEEAERILRAALERSPGHVGILTLLARSLIEQDRLDEAKAILVPLLRRQPRNDLAALRRARIALREGDVAAVREVIRGLAAGRDGGGPIP